MAQPQHVRNDTHCDRWYCDTIGQLNPSLYEEWTDTHRAQLPYGGAAVHFSRLRDFWSNDAGTGIAQYTNRNFVSAGTNFAVQVDNNGQLIAAPNAEYPLPVPLGNANPIPIQTLLSQEPDYPCLGANAAMFPQCRLAGDVLFYRSAVQSRAATLSIFDQDLQQYNRPVRYSNTATGSIYVAERLFQPG